MRTLSSLLIEDFYATVIVTLGDKETSSIVQFLLRTYRNRHQEKYFLKMEK